MKREFGPVTITAAGGVAPYSSWSATIVDPPNSGNATITPTGPTTAVLTANLTSTRPANFTVSVSVSGANAKPQRSATVNYTISLQRNPPSIVSPAPGTFLGNATVGVPFGPVEIGAAGGTAPYSWSHAVVGAPASQVTLGPSTGNATSLTANFTTRGNVSVTVTASGGNRETSPPATYTIRVLPAPKPALSPAGGFLANATAGVPYGPLQFSASGGTPPYRWSANITSPAPDGSGISLAPSGVGNSSATLTGNFSKAATYGVRVTVSDSNPAGSQSVAGDFQINTSRLGSPPRVGLPSLPAAIIGVSYRGFTFSATGGVSPLAWSSLPSPPSPGLTLSPGGTLSGTPTESPGTPYPRVVPVVVTATDAISRSGSANATLLVVRPLSISGPATISGPRYQPIAPAQFAAAGGSGNFTWSATPGLPASVTINRSTGLLSGNLAAATGNYVVAVTVADPASGQTASQNCTISILPPGGLQWSTDPSLPSGKVSTAYSTNLTATGGKPGYAYATKAGSTLPTGLTLNSTSGRLSGTPTLAGNHSFTITARDSTSPAQTIERTFTLTVEPYGMVVNGPVSLVVQQYAALTPALYTVTGGRPAYTYNTSPALPAGLSLATTNATSGLGTISGNATAAPGNYTVALTVRDGANQPATQNVTITVTPPTPLVWVTEPALPDGKVLAAYGTNLTVTGGRPSYIYATKTGSTLPAGLTLNPTSGRLSGTPTLAGNHSFTITARDSAVPVQTIERTFTLAVEPYGMGVDGPSSLVVQQYAALTPALYTVTGGRPAYTYNTSPALPAGLSLATTNATSGLGTISGNATAAPGNYTVALTVRDRENQTATQNVTITVTPPTPLVWVTEPALPGGKVAAAYSTNLTVTGGKPSYTFTIKSGSRLPAGLTLNSTTGRLSGTPNLAGNYSFTVVASDSAAPAKNTIERTFSLTVEPYGMDFIIDCPIYGKVGQPLLKTYTITGGTPPYAFTVAGTLPAGISLNATAGRISGTPSVPGNFSVTWTLRDGRNQTVSKNCTIIIAPADPLVITAPADLGSTGTKALYTKSLQATGGTPGYTWSFASRGNLPANANLTSTGNLTANSTTQLAANFTVRVADTLGKNATKSMTLFFIDSALTDMVPVPGGTLPQGSGLAGQNVAPFLIGKHEVTWVEWQAVRTWASQNGYDIGTIGSGSGVDRPVASLNWYDAIKWCNALSEYEGLTPAYTVNNTTYRTGDFGATGSSAVQTNVNANGYRLPTEAEWEWAARGATAARGLKYPGSNDANAVAWHAGNSNSGTKTVGTKLANELGIFDMAGNVFEWCWDASGTNRNMRGGGFRTGPNLENCEVGFRVQFVPSTRIDFAGLRLARNADTTQDSDNDGVNDYRELYDGTAPFDKNSFDPLSIGLMAHYPLNGNIFDESGYGKHGTLVSGGFGAGKTGNSNEALSIQNDANHSKIPLNSNQFNGDLSIVAYIKFDDFQKDYPHILFGENSFFVLHGLGPAYGYANKVREVSYLEYTRIGSGYLDFDRRSEIYSSKKLNEKEWYQICVTRTNTATQIFIDGVLHSTAPSIEGILVSGNFIQIGKGYLFDPSHSMRGAIDDLKFYNRALSAAEVSQLYSEESDQPNMVLVQGGTLPESSELAGQTVSAFHIARFETSRAEWSAVVAWAKKNGYDLNSQTTSYPSHPIQGIKWYDAVKWCNAKSEMEGYTPVYLSSGAVYRTGIVVPQIQPSANGYRLPNENEWEWAARGGQMGGNFTYSGSNAINDVGWYSQNAFNPEFVFHQGDTTGIRPVGLKLANQLGICDMSGNVAEWCWEEVANNNRRVRGGWFSASAEQCSLSWRGGGWADGAHSIENIGFRYARSAIGDMVTVQGGTLPAGSELAGQKVQAFQIGRTEVTWDEWQSVRAWALANGYTDLAGVGDTYPTGSAGNFPVISLSWFDMVKWSNAKSQKEGLTPVYTVNGTIFKTGQTTPTPNPAADGYRLPSEAEWEWAARGGVSSQGYTYSGSNDINAVAWFWDNNSQQTKPVSTKAANELGIYDMSGNAIEAVWDVFDPIPSLRRYRGGMWRWDSSAANCAVAFRGDCNAPINRNSGFGLRLARNIGPKISITGELPEAVLNQPYAGFTFGVSGTNAPVAWSISEGTLPPGMSFSTTGTLSGTPTTAGTYTFVIRLESGGYWDEVEVELEVIANGFQLSSPWTLRWSGNKTKGGNFVKAWLSDGSVWLSHYALKYRSGKFLAGSVYSDDGLTWKTFTLPTNVNHWLNESGVAGNTFILNGAGNDLWNSTNGTTWTKRSNPGGYDDLGGIEFGNGTVVVNRYWSPGSLLVSKDLGNTWSFVDTGSFTFAPGTDGRHYERTIFGNNRFLFPLFDSVRTSADGLSWQTTAVTNRPAAFRMASVSNFDTRTQKFIGVQQTGSNATTKTITTAVSANGTAWTFRNAVISTANAAQFSGASIGEGFLVFGGGTPAEIWVSRDEGQTWSRATGPWEEPGVEGVAFAASPSRLVAATPSKIYSAELETIAPPDISRGLEQFK